MTIITVMLIAASAVAIVVIANDIADIADNYRRKGDEERTSDQ